MTQVVELGARIDSHSTRSQSALGRARRETAEDHLEQPPDRCGGAAVLHHVTKVAPRCRPATTVTTV
jgi:hypothetical protein